MAARVIAACGGSVRGKTIAVLGLTFKPETDDMRDAPSRADRLRGWRRTAPMVRAFDPEGMEQARPLLPEGVIYCRDALDAAQRRGRAGGDHRMERVPRARARRGCAATMRGRVLVDLRNVYDPAAMRAGRLRVSGHRTAGRLSPGAGSPGGGSRPVRPDPILSRIRSCWRMSALPTH